MCSVNSVIFCVSRVRQSSFVSCDQEVAVGPRGYAMREVRQCSIVYFGVPDCKTTRRSSMIEILLYLIGILSFPVLSTRVESMNASSDVILLFI